jgi:hypothetical protein
VGPVALMRIKIIIMLIISTKREGGKKKNKRKPKKVLQTLIRYNRKSNKNG